MVLGAENADLIPLIEPNDKCFVWFLTLSVVHITVIFTAILAKFFVELC